MPLQLVISSALFTDNSKQEIRTIDGLTVARLITEVVREYNLPIGAYCVAHTQADRILDPARTLEDQGVRTGDVLLFAVADRPAPSPPRHIAQLKSASGAIFPLNNATNLIGRRASGGGQSVTVDLTALDPEKTTSRQHAQIHRKGESYYLENLHATNPVYLNDRALVRGQLQILNNGDWVQLGSNIKLQFVLGNSP